MSTIELKNKILASLNLIENSSTLEKVFMYIENIRDTNNIYSEIVAYTTAGKPISKNAYIQQIKEADSAISTGN